MGAAEQKLGSDVTGAGVFYAGVAANDATNKWQQRATQILYGTGQPGPDGKPDRGFYGLTGEDAMRAMPLVQEQISSLRDEIGEDLPPISKNDYDSYTRRMQSYLYGEIGRHYEGQFQVYGDTVGKATADNSLNWVGSHAADENQVQHGIADLTNAYRGDAQLKLGANLPPEVLADTQSRAQRDGRYRQVESLLGSGNIAAAKGVLDQNQNLMSGDARWQATENRVRVHSSAALGASAADDAWSGRAGRPNAAIQSSLPTDWEAAKPLIQSKESHGNYTVGYGGTDLSHAPLDSTGFPQWAGVNGPAGPTHAAGAYQFEPTTWQRYAVPLGIHDFSPASQDRVAEAAFVAEGYAPWAASFGARRGIAAASSGAAPNVMAPLTQEQQPAALTTPIAPAPGVGDIATMQSQLATNYTAALGRLSQRQDLQDDPVAYDAAIRNVELRYRAGEVGLAAQQKALTDRRNAVADQFLQQGLKGGLTPDLLARVAASPDLDYPTREHLTAALINEAKHTAAGDAVTFGPEYFNYQQRLYLPDSDPNKIRDQSQIYALTQPRQDGSQGLTATGADRLTRMLRERSPETDNFQQQKAEFLKGVEPQIDKSAFAGVPDLKGKERFYQFQFDLDRRIHDYLSAMPPKNPLDLIDPKSPAYVGSEESLKPYRRTMDQVLADLPAGERDRRSIWRRRSAAAATSRSYHPTGNPECIPHSPDHATAS